MHCIAVHFLCTDKVSDTVLRQIMYPVRGRVSDETLRAFEAGYYKHVANVYTDDLEEAWGKVQNILTSWSEEPAPGVTPIGTGHRSAMVGDIFIVNDAKHVVAPFGFEKL